jgi:hypothetical protein
MLGCRRAFEVLPAPAPRRIHRRDLNIPPACLRAVCDGQSMLDNGGEQHRELDDCRYHATADARVKADVFLISVHAQVNMLCDDLGSVPK